MGDVVWHSSILNNLFNCSTKTQFDILAFLAKCTSILRVCFMQPPFCRQANPHLDILASLSKHCFVFLRLGGIYSINLYVESQFDILAFLTKHVSCEMYFYRSMEHAYILAYLTKRISHLGKLVYHYTQPPKDVETRQESSDR